MPPYVRSGAWYSRSESVLLPLLGSHNAKDRKFAVEMILKIRGNTEFGDLTVRDRKMPKLNLQATTHDHNMITLNVKESHEPVYTCRMTKNS